VDAAALGPASELELLIRSRYPVLYVVSWEETRLLAEVAKIAARRGKELYVWTVTAGLRKNNAGAPLKARSASGSCGDPVLDGLDAVIEHKEPAIYVFQDLHMFLHTRCQGNRAAIRKVRDVARALNDSYKTLIISAPLVDMAPELEKDVTVVDYALPAHADLDRLLGKIIDDVKDHPNVRIDLTVKSRQLLVRAAGGLTLQEAENVFAKTLVKDGALTGDDVSTVFAEKQQIIRKSGLLEYYEAQTGLSDVGGLGQLKEWLTRRSQAFTDEAQAFGLPAPKGVLLVGVQGCGKSLCAKAISREWNMPLLRLDVGRMFSSLVGSSEENIRRAISVAESVCPCVLWIDEIDKAFAGSQSSGGSDAGTTARVMSTFLTWLSEKTKPVFVVATANDITQLPPELMRKGRLDEIFFVDLPDRSEREIISRIHITKCGRKPDRFDHEQIAAAAEGFSGAEMEQAVISALYDCFSSGHDLATADVIRSLGETVPLSRTMSERIASLRAWAEGRARFASRADAPKAEPVRRKYELEVGDGPTPRS